MTLDATSTVTPLLPRGDLACELSDANLAQALHVQWLFRAGPQSFAGPARTVDARGGDVPTVREAAAKVNEGEVLIIDADGVQGAVLGDRIGVLIQERKAAGVVVIGNVRDVPKLQQMGLAVVAGGVVPSRAALKGPGKIDAALEIGAATIMPGDLVVADPNGVVIVPAKEFPNLQRFTEGLLAQD